MSINWVMTAPNEPGFIKLPNERILYTSPPRASLQLSPPNTVPGVEPWSAKSESGVAYITNQRIVYLPTNPTPELKSFSAPILNLQDSYVRAPFFGANYWIALCRPVPGGGIPASQIAVELRLTFRDGGAFDFSSIFEQIKERLVQAREAREATGAAADLTNVHLEQLPAYEAAQEANDEGPTILSPLPIRPGAQMRRSPAHPPVVASAAPDEPPPGYEEAQAQAVTVDLEERLRIATERQQDETP